MKWAATIFLILVLSAMAQAGEPPKPTPADLTRGKIIYQQNCVVCHGDKGQGDGPAAATLNPKPRNFAKDKFKRGTSPKEIFSTVTGGISGSAMAGFASMPEKDRWAVVFYITALRDGTVK